jgi:hemerythrin-like domain-containing protein
MKMPTDILREEHALILRALGSLETAAAGLAADLSLSPGWWDEMLAWLGVFADRSHHGKEEYVLFPAMMKAGAPHPGGPIDVMLEEHAGGRALIRAMAEGVPAGRAAAARAYVTLLRLHIEKENDIVFPLADTILDEADQRAVKRDFDGVEAELGREGSLPAAEARLDRLHRLARDASGLSGERQGAD